MKTRWIYSLRILLYLAITEVLFSSCSVIGFGLGSVIDKSTPKYSCVGADGLDEIRLNRRVSVFMKDSSFVQGIYKGYEVAPHLEYDDVYNEFTEKSLENPNIPNLEDSLSIAFRNSGLRLTGIFMGFGINKMYFTNPPGKQKSMVIMDASHAEVFYNGNALNYTVLKAMMQCYELPVNANVIIQSDDQRFHNIQAYKIEKLEVHNKRDSKLYLFGAGLFLDTILAIIITHEIANSLREIEFRI